MLTKKIFQKFCKKILEKNEQVYINQTNQAINQFFGEQVKNPIKIKQMENRQKSYVNEKLKMIKSLKSLKKESEALKNSVDHNINSQKDIIKIIHKIQNSSQLLSFYQKEKFYLVESNLLFILKKLSIIVPKEDKIYQKNMAIAKKRKEIIFHQKLSLSKNYQDFIFYLNKNFNDFQNETKISILVYLNKISKFENKEFIKDKILKIIEENLIQKLSFQELCMLGWLMSSIQFKNKTFLKNFDSVVFEQFDKNFDSLEIFVDYKDFLKAKEERDKLIKENEDKNLKNKNEDNNLENENDDNKLKNNNLENENKDISLENENKNNNLENEDNNLENENEENKIVKELNEKDSKKIKISLKKITILLYSYVNLPIKSSVPRLLITKILSENLIKDADFIVCLNLLSIYNMISSKQGFKLLNQLSEKFLKEEEIEKMSKISNLTHINFISVFSKIRPFKNKTDFYFFLNKNKNSLLEENIILEEKKIKKMAHTFFVTFLDKKYNFSNKNFSLIIWNLSLYNYNLEKRHKKKIEDFFFDKIYQFNCYDTVLLIYSFSKLISNYSLNSSLNFQYNKIITLLITRCFALKKQLEKKQFDMINEVIQKNIKEFSNLKTLYKDNRPNRDNN